MRLSPYRANLDPKLLGLQDGQHVVVLDVSTGYRPTCVFFDITRTGPAVRLIRSYHRGHPISIMRDDYLVVLANGEQRNNVNDFLPYVKRKPVALSDFS